MQAHHLQQTKAPSGVLDDYLTRAQLAEQLRVTPRTLTRWKWERKGPPSVLIGGRVHYKKSIVEAWLDSLAKERAGAAE